PVAAAVARPVTDRAGVLGAGVGVDVVGRRAAADVDPAEEVGADRLVEVGPGRARVITARDSAVVPDPDARLGAERRMRRGAENDCVLVPMDLDVADGVERARA